MNKFRERLIDPKSPDRRPRRAAYALPTLFTAGNVFLGFFAIMESFRGSMLTAGEATGAAQHFANAAIAIAVAHFLDGLDGRIARMTNTVSEFGREMDSLADVITFGIAPAVMAFAWGVEFVGAPTDFFSIEALRRAGYFLGFFYLLCGAMRLARFNVQVNPVPKNPGRPDRKYFVGMPIPAAASVVAAVIFAAGGVPLRSWIFSTGWLLLLGLLSFLMVSTWRYPSFKEVNLLRPHSPWMFVVTGSVIYLVWIAPQPVLLALAVGYMMSGICLRLGGIARRILHPDRPHPEPPPQEHPVG